MNTCKCCAAHRAEMLRVWRGLYKLYRKRLNPIRRDPTRKAERKALVTRINSLVAKMRSPLEPCPWGFSK